MRIMPKNKLLLVLLLSVVVFGLLLGGCQSQSDGDKNATQKPDEQTVLFAYVGAGLKEPVTKLVEIYEEQTGVKVEMTFGNSAALLTQLETSKKGDIYMPGGMPYIEQAKGPGHLSEVVGPVAYHVPIIVTPKGNPAGITSVEDLTKPGVQIIMPEKEGTAVGKTAFKIFDKMGISDQVEKNILTDVETLPKVIATLEMGQGNAGISEYSHAMRNKDKVDFVEIPVELNIIEEIPCAMVSYSTQKEAAQKFLDFMLEKGPEIFAENGYKISLD